MILDKITPIDLHIAKKLRQFRLEFGMTQDELGELTGLSFQQIQKYEKAKNRIPASRLFEFSQLLEQPIAAFFLDLKADRMHYNYEFESEKKQVKKSDEFNKEIAPLISAFRAIESANARKHLLALAIAIAEPKRKKVKHAYS